MPTEEQREDEINKLIKKGKEMAKNQMWETENSKRLQSFFFKKCECTIFTRITRGTYFTINQQLLFIVHNVSIKSNVIMSYHES